MDISNISGSDRILDGLDASIQIENAKLWQASSQSDVTF
jgi:hypothetical protein